MPEIMENYEEKTESGERINAFLCMRLSVVPKKDG
jgi:hypothetical protein